MATDERDDIWYACGYTAPPQQGQTLGLGYLYVPVPGTQLTLDKFIYRIRCNILR